MKVLRFLQVVDRRFLYALLLLAVILPFYITVQLPVIPSQPTIKFYDMVEGLAPGSFVLLGIDWSAGTRGENGPETEAIMEHLMRHGVHFGILAFGDPQGKTLGEEAAIRLSRRYGYREGIDWANFGYKVDMQNFVKAMVEDVPRTLGTDIHNHPAASLPVMHGINTAKDFSALIDVTPSATYQTYIQFVAGPAKVPMGAAVTAVMAPEAFNYLDSGQVKGLLQGLSAAGEYQKLLGTTSRVTDFSNSSSCAHLLIIFLILMGNAAMLLERRRTMRYGGGQ